MSDLQDCISSISVQYLKTFHVYVCPLSLALYEKADIKAPEDKNKHLIIGVSSDRGLCGAIHSSVAKTMKNEIAKLAGAGKEVMVVNVGDKLRGLLYRYASYFLCTNKVTSDGFYNNEKDVNCG